MSDDRVHRQRYVNVWTEKRFFLFATYDDPIRGPRRSCFALKALELCRDVNNEKRTRLDNTLGAAAWWRKFATLSISISDVLILFSPNFPAKFLNFEFRVDVSFFPLFTSRHNSSVFDAKHDRRDPLIGCTVRTCIRCTRWRCELPLLFMPRHTMGHMNKGMVKFMRIIPKKTSWNASHE